MAIIEPLELRWLWKMLRSPDKFPRSPISFPSSGFPFYTGIWRFQTHKLSGCAMCDEWAMNWLMRILCESACASSRGITWLACPPRNNIIGLLF
jgi:hypothetical protein